jgi:hypothetical protein
VGVYTFEAINYLAMKKLLIASVLVVAITMLSGCLSTLHPLFTEKDLVFDPRLIGSWKTNTDDDVLVFEKGTAANFSQASAGMQKLAGKGYLLTITEPGNAQPVIFYAFLARIGKHTYLDYYPAETPAQKKYNTFYKGHYIKMHTFDRFRFFNGESFETAQFDQNHLDRLISQKKIRIQHEKHPDGGYIITAPTAELQQYVLKYGDTKEAYESTSLYHKIP